MKKFYYLLILGMMCSYVENTQAQAPPDEGFGGFHTVNYYQENDEISPEQRKKIVAELKASAANLRARGILPERSMYRGTQAVKFGFPLRKAADYTAVGFYGISGYVDVDPTTGIKDYNCGTRTYDGHMGTDYFIFPFPWAMKDAGDVEVIAAADGIILYTHTSSPDTSCAMCTEASPADCWYWNAVYVQNTDGTVCYYGHMKKGSVTSKVIGDAVTKGEYLGKVGSSGSSSGPHMHFEVWTDENDTKLINPWEGPCNPDGNASYWDNQEPYYNSGMTKVYTSSQLPTFSDCYEDGKQEVSYAKDTFTIGEMVYLINFARDNVPGGGKYHVKIIRPGGQVAYQWDLDPFNENYPWAWFYYNYADNVFNEAGDWQYEVSYGGTTATHKFTMMSPTPLNLLSFTGRVQNNGVKLDWKTSEEVNTDRFSIERSTNGTDFIAIGSVSTRGNGGNANMEYSFTDAAPSFGDLFYRLKMLDLDGRFTYSNVQKFTLKNEGAVTLFPNPAGNTVTLKGASGYRELIISNMQGVQINHQRISGNQPTIDISSLPSGLYIIQLVNDTGTKKLKLIKK